MKLIELKKIWKLNEKQQRFKLSLDETCNFSIRGNVEFGSSYFFDFFDGCTTSMSAAELKMWGRKFMKFYTFTSSMTSTHRLWLRLGKRTGWMFGNTPPWAIVTCLVSSANSSSFRMALETKNFIRNCINFPRISTYSWMWRGMMRFFLLSLAAFPDNSRTSAATYSMTAAK